MQETSRDLRDCTSNTLETQERGQLNTMIAAYFSHRARWRHWKNSGRSEALPQRNSPVAHDFVGQIQQVATGADNLCATYLLTYLRTYLLTY